jgi:hypothetical protein
VLALNFGKKKRKWQLGGLGRRQDNHMWVDRPHEGEKKQAGWGFGPGREGKTKNDYLFLKILDLNLNQLKFK